MNPLTLVKRIQKINSREAALGISEEASWHAKYKDSAYVFVGGIPFDLTEGDLLAVFAQYGEIVDVNLVRDKGTGKSKGFAFIAYEDQRSTNLAVDNLNGAQVLGRTVRVDHVADYKKKEEEDEEAEKQKREARGVCRAFQRGECNRGAGCKFSHDEQRAANTGWGAEDKSSRWGHEEFDRSTKREKRSGTTNRFSELKANEIDRNHREDRGRRGTENKSSVWQESERNSRDEFDERDAKRSRRHELKSSPREDRDDKGTSIWQESERNSRDEFDKRDARKSRKQGLETFPREDRDDRGRDRRSSQYRDSSYSHRHRERHEDHRHKSDG